jgi:hypothetical protein
VSGRCQLITPHPSFVVPSNPEILLWRYMDLTKFVALLHDRALYFARADELGDPFEGSLPKKNRKILEEALTDQLDSSRADQHLNALSQANKSFRTIMNISCWHVNEHESAAMWGLYSKSNDAIWVQTTYKILASILPEQVNAGLVTYIDYEKDSFDGGNIFNAFMHKRISYEHDRELRAIVVSTFPPGNAPNLPKNFVFSEHGVKVPVDLDLLIQKIFVSPASPKWFKEIVESLRDHYSSGAPVIQSSLASDPIY